VGALLYQPGPDPDIRYTLTVAHITTYLFGISAPATAINFAISTTTWPVVAAVDPQRSVSAGYG